MRALAPAVLFLSLGVFTAHVGWDVLHDSNHASASHTGGADVFSVDMNPFGPTPNTATSLGTRQTCAGIKLNGVQDADEDAVDKVILDVTATQIPASTAMSAVGFDLMHDAVKLTVAGHDSAFLILSAPGSTDLIDFSYPLGRYPGWGAGFLDMGPGGYDSGSGVLQRITMAANAGAGGLYDLTLVHDDYTAHYDDQNIHHIPDAVQNAQLLVGGHCTDSDADGVFDVDETACGGNANSASLRPERTDGAFATTDDDGDTLVNEPLPAGSETYDCDGDGWKGNEENLIFSTAPGTVSDQDPCGNNGWPSDLQPNNILNIGDIGSFTTTRPVADQDAHGTFNTFNHALDDDGDTAIETAEDPGAPGGATYNVARWNLQTPPHLATTQINIGDLGALQSGAFGSGAKPPMFGGQPAFGRTCPWPA